MKRRKHKPKTEGKRSRGMVKNCRHCGRSEAIQYSFLAKHRSGLLRQGSQRRTLHTLRTLTYIRRQLG